VKASGALQDRHVRGLGAAASASCFKQMNGYAARYCVAVFTTHQDDDDDAA
jgi:hypothetical protein